MAYLELENLSKHFTKRTRLFGPVEEIRAVDRVNLSIEQGEIVGLVGESGCGKSTLSRLIMQLIPPTEGSVILEDVRMSDLSRAEIRMKRREFQMIFQDPYASLNPRMTVFSTLAEAIGTRHPDKSSDPEALGEAVADLMQRVGLDSRSVRKYPHEFSGGQRQRIAVARALATEPKLIIADEPVSALDVSIQSQILNLLRNLCSDLGLTMLFISHDLSVVKYIADRIAVMEKGQIVETGLAEKVFDSPSSECAKKLLGAIPQIHV